MQLRYKLDSFEGPLDLLLHLIDKNEIDIYDIPIARITDQYMEYMAQVDTVELEIASEFLLMAATLLYIKSRMLLPKPPAPEPEEWAEEEEIDPREELVQKLIEYRKYKLIAEALRDRELARSLIFSREPEDLSVYVPEEPVNPLQGIVTADLLLAFRKAMARAVRRDTAARIRRDEISVKDRIREVLGTLRRSEDGRTLFSRLLDSRPSREGIVVTFLAVLELMKNGIVTCYQHRLFEDIVIQYKGGDDDGLWADEIDY